MKMPFEFEPAEMRKYLAPVLLGICLIFILFLPSFVEIIVASGKRIPQPDIITDYFKGWLWALILGITILFWPVGRADKKALIVLWAVKCVVMLGLMLAYEYHYQTDAFGYFAGARYAMCRWNELELGGPSTPVVFICWLHQHSFFDSFHAVKVTFGMIGLFSLYVFYRAAVIFLRQEKLVVLYIIALYPSILFWSSILSKDALALLGMCVYCYGVIKFARSGAIDSAIIMILGLFYASSIRYWLAFIIGIPAIIVLVRAMPAKKNAVNIAIIVLIGAFVAFYSLKVMSAFHFKTAKDIAIVANDKYRGFAGGGSLVSEIKQEQVADASVPITAAAAVEPAAAAVNPAAAAVKPAAAAVEPAAAAVEPAAAAVEPAAGAVKATPAAVKAASAAAPKKFGGIADVILFVPRGIFTVLFRPLPWETRNMFSLFSGLEDLILLILFSGAMLRLSRAKLKDPLVLWAIMVISFWAAAYGFVSYNLGTVSRYRLQILPLFLGLILYLLFWNKGEITEKKDK